MDLEGLSHDEASKRVTATFKDLLEKVPGANSSGTFLHHVACIPGCILLLATLGVLQDVNAEGWGGGGAEEGEDVAGEFSGTDDGGGSLSEDPLGLEGWEAGFENGVWNVPVSGGSARNAPFFYAFQSISAYEAKAQDGSLRAAFVAFLNRAAAAEGATPAAPAASSPVVVGSWGAQLQLALRFPEGPLSQLPQHIGGCSSGNPSNRGLPNSSNPNSRGMAARAAIVKGHAAVLDKEVVLGRHSSHKGDLSLQLLLPSAGSTHGGSGSTTKGDASADVAALYFLPLSAASAEKVAWDDGSAAAAGDGDGALGQKAVSSNALACCSTTNTHSGRVGTSGRTSVASSSSGGNAPASSACALAATPNSSSTSSSSTLFGGVPLEPLAHLTLLLLPPAQAQELLHWVEVAKLSQQQLQPLLEDMAVAMEATAAVAAAGGGAVAGVGGLGLGAASFTVVLERAAAAAGQVVCCFETYGLMLNRRAMFVCYRELMCARLRMQGAGGPMSQIAVAGALPGPAEKAVELLQAGAVPASTKVAPAGTPEPSAAPVAAAAPKHLPPASSAFAATAATATETAAPCSSSVGTAEGSVTPSAAAATTTGAAAVDRAVLVSGVAANQSIKTQDQQCQWPNKPRPQTQGS